MIGLIAASLTTLGFVPQVVKVLKTKDTESISLGVYSMSVTGMLLWLAHGISISDIALIAANSISATLAGTILICKLIYKQFFKNLK
ncbi:SemiSWEET transporter [Streptococcus gallolyticus]|uniref:MtN3 and saliva related transmembrane protein n=2 Tax=Streptococcus gallolyticus TaxID=315405 RepID=A0A1H9TMH1_9STRE|nr:SemiSWEET transporter [Streptococcus gallolyticus]SER98278.1 MtN3 and saliva related transmembrane protein [Streptococcus gallolyticus]